MQSSARLLTPLWILESSRGPDNYRRPRTCSPLLESEHFSRLLRFYIRSAILLLLSPCQKYQRIIFTNLSWSITCRAWGATAALRVSCRKTRTPQPPLETLLAPTDRPSISTFSTLSRIEPSALFTIVMWLQDVGHALPLTIIQFIQSNFTTERFTPPIYAATSLPHCLYRHSPPLQW